MAILNIPYYVYKGLKNTFKPLPVFICSQVLSWQERSNYRDTMLQLLHVFTQDFYADLASAFLLPSMDFGKQFTRGT